MKYKIIYEKTEEALESTVNDFIKDIELHLEKEVHFIGSPFQVQHGPQSFVIAQAFYF